MVIVDTGPVEDIHAFILLQKVKIWIGVTDASRTDSLTTLKDRATQLLIKYKSRALVTQQHLTHITFLDGLQTKNGKMKLHIAT